METDIMPSIDQCCNAVLVLIVSLFVPCLTPVLITVTVQAQFRLVSDDFACRGHEL